MELEPSMESFDKSSNIKFREIPFITLLKTSQLMLYKEIIAVCSEIHTKHINTVCGAERGIVEC